MLYSAEEIRTILLAGTLTVLVIAGLIIVLIVTFQRNVLIRQRAGFIQVLTAVEKERQRIGQDLHDDVGPLLAGVKLGLNAFSSISQDNPTIEKIVTEQKQFISQAIASIRESAHELSPSTLLRFGLVKAVQERCNQLSANNHWKAQVVCESFPNGLSEASALNIFRILCELMHNSIKHSQGNEIIVRFSETVNKLEIAYSDNGIGMKNSSHSYGLGLNGIKSRMGILQGTIQIATGSANGFQANLAFETAKLIAT